MGGVQRFAVGAVSPQIVATFRDGTGAAVDVGAVTVVVVDWSGATVLASTAADGAGTGAYRAILPAAAVAAVTQLTATWTAAAATATTTVDVVGSRIVWPDEVFDTPGTSIRHDVDKVAGAIAWFEDRAYEALNWSPIVRFNRGAVCAGGAGIFVPDAYVVDLLGVTWTSPGSADLVASPGELALLSVSAGGLLVGSYSTAAATVAYTHGLPVVDASLRDVALIAIRDRLNQNSAGRPMVSVANDVGGTTRFSLSGPGRPTGIPDVDVVLNARRIPSLA